MKFQITIRDLLWLLVVIGLVLAWRIDRSRAPQWEYEFHYMTVGGDHASELNKRGTEGWEAWSYQFGVGQPGVWFKRQKR